MAPASVFVDAIERDNADDAERVLRENVAGTVRRRS